MKVKQDKSNQRTTMFSFFEEAFIFGVNSSDINRNFVKSVPITSVLTANDDVVDRNKDKLHEKANKAHNKKANTGCDCYFHELCEQEGYFFQASNMLKSSQPSINKQIPLRSGLLHLRRSLILSSANLMSGRPTDSKAFSMCECVSMCGWISRLEGVMETKKRSCFFFKMT